MSRQKLDLSVLYEDDDLLVVDKPAGLLAIPDRWDPSKPTVVKLARAYVQASKVDPGLATAPPEQLTLGTEPKAEPEGTQTPAQAPAPPAASETAP